MANFIDWMAQHVNIQMELKSGIKITNVTDWMVQHVNMQVEINIGIKMIYFTEKMDQHVNVQVVFGSIHQPAVRYLERDVVSRLVQQEEVMVEGLRRQGVMCP